MATSKFRSISLAMEHLRSEPQRKSYPVILSELIQWRRRNAHNLADYFILRLYRKNQDIMEYLGRKEYIKIHDIGDPLYYRNILEDKYVFQRYMSGINFPIPPMPAMIYHNEVYWLKDGRREPLSELQQYELHVFCKLNIAFGGSHVFKLDIENGNIRINNEESTREKLESLLFSGMYVMQETLQQHDELNRLNPGCVNTLRVYTVNRGAQRSVLGGHLRIGIDKLVDNVSQGGIICGVEENGRLFDTAFSYSFKRKTWSEHPVTRTKFDSVVLPDYDQTCEVVCKMHDMLPFFFLVAWDVAFTRDGIRIIEANPVSDLVGEQFIYGKGLKKEIEGYFREFMG